MDKVDKHSSICPLCQQPKSSQASGSLTQWISLCQCDRIIVEPTDFAELYICLRCGKPTHAGRPGSITQWIFRWDICACDRLVPISQAPEARPVDKEPTLDQIDDLCPGLELDPNKFPIERYKPLSELSHEENGAVYLCRDLSLNKEVVVKVQNSLAQERLVTFQREAKATSKLNHPNVVRILDFGVTRSGAPYMVMEYIMGIPLDKLIRREGRLNPAMSSKIIADICEALKQAHAIGIYHRDLKPGNIIVVDQGNQVGARLIDFGVVHMKDDALESAIYGENRAIGTPAYMSADSINSGTYDARSEIYSLGCILFELLTGSPPFSGQAAMEIIYKQANQKAPTVKEINPSLCQPALEKIVDTCLEKDPDNRFQNIDLFLEALESAALEKKIEKEPD
ncbi:MAG: serine/threonine protein kinase, partial [Candidatus Obscuribacterales bacterium]|nr:serine/threonine protein kinase [Candidatus Obscuribacterales bacterium]